MSDHQLRDQIVAAAAEYLSESGAYFNHYTDDLYTVDGDISLIDLADTVIERLVQRLALRAETRVGPGEPGEGLSSFIRYVTDWTVDE